MAFAELFTKLSAPLPHNRDDDDDDDDGDINRRSNYSKWETRSDQAESYQKKRHFKRRQTEGHHVPGNSNNDNSEAFNSHFLGRRKEHAVCGFSGGLGESHSRKANHNHFYHKNHNYKSRNNCDVNLQQCQRIEDAGQKRQRDQRWTSSRGRGRQWGDRRVPKNSRKDIIVKHVRFMSEEFKQQNGVLLDGQLICRHFLSGKCIKGDDCQLLHSEITNGMIKEACRFYIQGFCLKGDSCPYMHKSFPCKFFHRLGRCSQEGDCRFSHEPLTEATSQLLEEAFKQDSDQLEPVQKSEKFPSDQSPVTDESVIPDVLAQPISTGTGPYRPNFYNSTDVVAGKENVRMEEFVDEAQTQSQTSADVKQEAPVCYSVEAVLGPQLSKPFPSFFGTSRSKMYPPLSVPPTSFDCAVGSGKQSEGRQSDSSSTVKNPAFGPSSNPLMSQASSCNKKAAVEDVTEPQSIRNVVDKSPFKRRPMFQVHTTDPSTKTHPDFSSNFENTAVPRKPAQRTSALKWDSLHSVVPVSGESVSFETKVGTKVDAICCKSLSTKANLQRDRTRSLDSTSERFGPTKSTGKVLFSLFSRPPNEASPTTAAQNPHLSRLSSGASHSFNTTDPLEQPTELHGDSTEMDTDVKQPNSNKLTPMCKASNSAPLAAGCRETQSKLFQRLFAGSITGSVASPATPKGRSKPVHHLPQSVDARSNSRAPAVIKPVGPILTSSVSPVSDAVPHLSRQFPQNRGGSCPRESHQSGSGSSQRTLDIPFSSLFSGFLDSDVKQRPVGNPVCSFVPDSPGEISVNPLPNSLDPSTIQTPQPLSDIPSTKAHLKETSATSVLKTLFVSLSSYESEPQQHAADPPEIKNSMPNEVQHESRKKIKVDPEPHQGLNRGLTHQSPALREDRVRTFSTESDQKVKPVHCSSRATPEETSGEGNGGNPGQVRFTPLKELFKTLDPTAFNFGH